MSNWTNANGGNWNTSGNWSDGVPNSTKDAVFPAGVLGAGKTVQVDATANCKNLDFSGLDISLTFVNSAYALNVYGNYTGSSNLVRNFTGTGYMYFKSTSNQTITSNLDPITGAFNRIYFDGVGGSFTNQDNWNFGIADIYLKNGTWLTNDKSIRGSRVVTDTGTKTWNLGSSSVTLSNGLGILDATGLTIIPGTSTINASGDWLICGGKTFNDINWTSTRAIGGQFGNFTCNNLTINSWASILHEIPLNNNITINGVLAVSGSNVNNQRVLLRSNAIGTARTITVDPAKCNITNADFQDITFTNPIDLSAQTDIGNCFGNSGITFPPALDLYIVHTSGAMSVSNAAKWKLADLTSAGRVPLPQDSAFGVVGSFTGASTVTMDCPRIGSLDLSGVDKAVTWALGNNISCYGHYVLGVNVTLAGSYDLIFMKTGSWDVNFYNATSPYNYIIFYQGTRTFKSDFSTATNKSSFSFNGSAIVDFNDFNITINILSFNSGNPIVYFGNGLVNIIAMGTWGIYGIVGTLYCEGSTVKLFPNSESVNKQIDGNRTYNILWLSGLNSGNFIIPRNNTFAQLIVDPGRKLQITAATTQTISPIGKLVNNGSIDSTTAAQFNLVYAGTGFHQMTGSFKSCNATPNRFYTTGADNGGNTGIVFGTCWVLSGALLGKGALQGSITRNLLLTGAVNGTGTIQGTLTALKVLVGTLQGKGALQSDITALSSLEGTLYGEGTLNANLGMIGALQGDLLGTGTMQGFLNAVMILQGALLGEGTLDGDLSWEDRIYVSRVLNLLGTIKDIELTGTIKDIELTGTIKQIELTGKIWETEV